MDLFALMSGTVCILFERRLVVSIAAAVDVFVMIIAPPLPIVCAILVIVDFSVVLLKRVELIALYLCDAWL